MNARIKNRLYRLKMGVIGIACKIPIFLKLIRQYKIKKLLSFPTDVIIELTNICNLDCIMCPRKRMQRNMGNMDFELFARIVDESIKGGARRILPFFFGEPFIQSDIGKYLSYIRSKSRIINISILTNGILMNGERIDELFKNRVNAVAVSLDAAEIDTYESIRRKGNLKQAEDNIKELVKRRKEKKLSLPSITVQFVVMDKNRDEIEIFRKKWEGIVDNVVFGACTNRGQSIEPFISHKGVKYMPCYRLWNEIAVCNDGKVALCCNDWNCSVTLGDVNSQTLGEIWRGKKLQHIRDMHLTRQRGNLSLCNKCYPEEWDSAPQWWQ